MRFFFAKSSVASCYGTALNLPTGVKNLGGTRAIYRDEGLFGLYRGTTLALVGVGNGALQFMAYEKMKLWAFERKRRRLEKLGREWGMEDDKLVRTTHTSPKNKRKLTAVALLVQYSVYVHVCRVEDRGVMRNIPIPSDPLTHSGKRSLSLVPQQQLTNVSRTTLCSRVPITAPSHPQSHTPGRTKA